MSKLDLFRFGSMRRRKIAVYLTTIVAVILAAALFMVSIGFFSYRSELVTVTATETDVGDTAAGTGVNAELIPNVNMISDSSFESIPVPLPVLSRRDLALLLLWMTSGAFTAKIRS